MQPIKFAQLPIPDGIATDRHGNVIVISLDPNNAFQNKISVFAPVGMLSKQRSIAGTGKMASESATGQIWLLSDRRVLAIDPDTLSISFVVNISDLAVDTSNMYDVAVGGLFLGVIDPQLATYDDFALLRRGNQLDMFVAGHYNAWQFVLRIRFLDQIVQSAKAIVTSGASLAPYDNGPHGVAVNPQGTVLTTLGWAPSSPTGGTVDRPVVFGADFPEGQSIVPQYVLDTRHTFSSRGMTSDTSGDFYVATGSVGGGTACGGAASLITLSSTMTDLACHNFTSVLANPQDVALSSGEESIYVTDAPLGENGSVWRFSR